MSAFPASLSVRAARERYFAEAGFQPGYDQPWVEVKAGPLSLRFPNAPGRVRAVRLHDLHHVATGYDTSWTGEGEIGAWELASGCGRHAWAWALNFAAFAIGLWIAPRRVSRAFVRGRHTRSLYRTEGEFREELLDLSVGALRERLALDRPLPRASARDALAFVPWALGAIAYAAGNVAIVAAVVALGVRLAS
jgi:hypothetical protein